MFERVLQFLKCLSMKATDTEAFTLRDGTVNAAGRRVRSSASSALSKRCSTWSYARQRSDRTAVTGPEMFGATRPAAEP